MLAALALFVLALPSCATLRTSEAEQEELITQIQKEEGYKPAATTSRQMDRRRRLG